MGKQFHLHDLFTLAAEAVPDRMAIIDLEGSLTYAELHANVLAFSGLLAQRGVVRGDKVGLYLLNSRTYIVAFLASCRLGAIPFNVNYRYKDDELRYLFDNADARVVIYEEQFVHQVERLCQNLPQLEIALCRDAALGDALSTAPAPPAPNYREDDYLLLYTGGTTGHPKGVMWPHKDFFYACLGGGGIYLQAAPIADVDQQSDMARNGPEIRIFPLAPLMHGAAIWTSLAALLGGLTLILDPLAHGFDATYIWRRIRESEANIVQIVGDAMATPLLIELQENGRSWALDHLFALGSGGAVFSATKKQAFKDILPNLIITDGMGASETGISGMAQSAEAGGMMRLESNERQRVIIDGRFAEQGELGYLARGGYLPLGYYKDPVKTASLFTTINGARWSVSGDQARLDADGMITVFGRGATCINSGGEKIYPEEVEEVLRSHPAIYDASVVGLADDKWGEAVATLISLNEGADRPAFDDLKQFCKTKLADYKIPKFIGIAENIERSPAGKQNYAWAKQQLILMREQSND